MNAKEVDENVPNVGANLLALRRRRRLSLRALAELSDLSPNTISLIERGVSSPSVSTLHRLALALRTPITDLLQSEAVRASVVFSRVGERTRSGSAGTVLESLGAGLKDQALEPFEVTLSPGAGSGSQTVAHAGNEVVYCLHGHIEYEVADQPYRLSPGDALLFEARLPHRWRNPGDEPARFILIFEVAAAAAVDQHLHP